MFHQTKMSSAKCDCSRRFGGFRGPFRPNARARRWRNTRMREDGSEVRAQHYVSIPCALVPNRESVRARCLSNNTTAYSISSHNFRTISHYDVFLPSIRTTVTHTRTMNINALSGRRSVSPASSRASSPVPRIARRTAEDGMCVGLNNRPSAHVLI